MNVEHYSMKVWGIDWSVDYEGIDWDLEEYGDHPVVSAFFEKSEKFRICSETGKECQMIIDAVEAIIGLIEDGESTIEFKRELRLKACEAMNVLLED